MTKTLYPVDYKDGQLWLDIVADDLIRDQIQIDELPFECIQPPISVLGQSTNLFLPNIPYVRLGESDWDIEQMGIAAADEGNESHSAGYHMTAKIYWIKGYKAKSAKKYTEEQVRDLLYKAGQRAVFSKEQCLDLVEELIQSIEPKVKSIEVEMEGIKDFMSEETFEKVWNHEHAEQLWNKYKPYKNFKMFEKNGSIYLTVKKVNYG